MNGYDFDRCQGYMRHMDQEHARLNKELRRLQSEVQSGASRAAILTDLETMRRDLAAHFCEEEGEGCLEEAVSRCPSLAHEVRAIEAEHRQLLEQLDGIIARQRLPDGISAADLESFAAAIDRHEAAEDHVVQHGFNVAVDA
jgi:hemerythrin